MTNAAADRLLLATSIRQARDALGAGRVALAGGTWLMRAAIRGEVLPRRFVSLGGIAALRQIEMEDDWLAIGAAVTHAKLDRALLQYPQLRALRVAATLSANPAIRRVATVGGNLCSIAFAASDLAPALLALNAEAKLETKDGPVTLSMAEFLARRAELLPHSLLTTLRVPLSIAHSAHQRLPLRKAGDYPAAIVSMAMIGERLAIAVGSVEPAARRWSALEVALQDGLPSPESAAGAAAAANDFKGRDGPEADGWYRREVLPALVRRGVAELWESCGR